MIIGGVSGDNDGCDCVEFRGCCATDDICSVTFLVGFVYVGACVPLEEISTDDFSNSDNDLVVYCVSNKVCVFAEVFCGGGSTEFEICF